MPNLVYTVVTPQRPQKAPTLSIIIPPEDPLYDAVYAAWLGEGRPYKLLNKGQAYIAHLDNSTLSFITIDRDDPTWLDPSDPSGQWHNAYGYVPNHEVTNGFR